MKLESLLSIWCVWRRYFAVFRKSILYFLITTFLEPILYLLAFGIGVGSLVKEFDVGGTPMAYRSFIFSGIIAQTVLFLGFFEGAYGGFFRMHYQRIFQAISSTPVTLSEVIWAELLWDASKASMASLFVVIIGIVMGEFPLISFLILIPICFLGGMTFAAMGLCAAAYSKNIDQLSYPQFLVVFPMFLFCGIFYPIENLALPFQVVAWLFPLTPIISIVRTVTLGLPFAPHAVALSLVWLVALVMIARRAMLQRLVK